MIAPVVLFALMALLAQTPASRAAALAGEGEKHLEANRLDRARMAFEESLKLDSSQFAAHVGLGFVYFSSDRFADARKHLEAAVAARPKAFLPRFLLGATFVQLSDAEAAIKHL